MTTTTQTITGNPINCTHEQLFKAISKNPTPQLFRYVNHSSEQYVAFTIALIILLNQHGDASKRQAELATAEAKGVNTHTHQAALFASSTQGLSVRRKYEQQDWQAPYSRTISSTQVRAARLASPLHKPYSTSGASCF
jgi:hypothetical protein